jgi:hypothetical protein
MREGRVVIELILPIVGAETFDPRNAYTAFQRILQKCDGAEVVVRMNRMLRLIPPIGSSVLGTSHARMIKLYMRRRGLLVRISLRPRKLLRRDSGSWVRSVRKMTRSELARDVLKSAMRGHIGSLAICGLMCNRKPTEFVKVFGTRDAGFFWGRGARRGCIDCLGRWMSMGERGGINVRQFVAGLRRGLDCLDSGSVIADPSERRLRSVYSCSDFPCLVHIIQKLWFSSKHEAAIRLLELTRGGPRDGYFDAMEALVYAGFSLPRSGEDAVVSVKQILAGATLPALPSREKWPAMAGPRAANWRFILACALQSVNLGAEAAAEFRGAGNGGNAFAWAKLSLMHGSIELSQLRSAIEAGDAMACGVAATNLGSSSGAARRELLEIAELGIRRGDLASSIGVARDLAQRGRRKEATAVLRKLDHAPAHARFIASRLECLALRAVGKVRAAERVLRWMARRGMRVLDDAPGDVIDELVSRDREWARAFVLAEFEGLALW